MDIIKNTAGSILSYNGTPLGTTWGAAPSPTFPTDGLVARWQFEDDLTDSWGSYDLTGNSTITYDTGLVGEAFDSLNNRYLYTTASAVYSLFSGTNAHSLSFWIKKIRAYTTAEVSCVWSATVSGGYNNAMQVYEDSGGFVMWRRQTSDTLSFAQSDIDLFDGEWHHIVRTYNGTLFRCVADGDIGGDGDKSKTTTAAGGAMDRMGVNVRGTSQYVGDNNTFDQMYIYDRALDNSEILALYNSGSGI